MKLKKIARSIWEFPQNALGFIVKTVCEATPYTIHNEATVYTWDIPGGMSLGRYIFVPFKRIKPTEFHAAQMIKHEYGHTIQSKYLGWFYLLVIGLPSLLWAWCFDSYRTRTGKSYYSFYTEKWADKLGEVERSKE